LMLVIDGYDFQLKNFSKDRSVKFWRCVNRPCHVLLHKTVKNEFIRYGGKSSVHSHLPNPSASEIRFFGGPFLRDFIYGGHFIFRTFFQGPNLKDISSRTFLQGHSSLYSTKISLFCRYFVFYNSRKKVSLISHFNSLAPNLFGYFSLFSYAAKFSLKVRFLV
jgi:hypothetical protein